MTPIKITLPRDAADHWPDARIREWLTDRGLDLRTASAVRLLSGDIEYTGLPLRGAK